MNGMNGGRELTLHVVTMFTRRAMPKKEAIAEARRDFAKKLKAAKEEGDAAMEKVGVLFG